MSTQSAVVIFPSCESNHRELVALGHVTVFKGPFKQLTKPFLNGIGGKIEARERPEEAALREFSEEVVVDGEQPSSQLLACGVVEVFFCENEGPPKREEPDVLLHVFKMVFDRKVDLFPNPEHAEFESIDWYDRTSIAYPQTRLGGACILPSDRFWLPHFLIGNGNRSARIEITRQFKVWETGAGDEYRSGRMEISS